MNNTYKTFLKQCRDDLTELKAYYEGLNSINKKELTKVLERLRVDN